MANPTNGKSMERDGEEPLDPQGMSLAAALWSFEERLLTGETPDPESLISLYPEKEAELEGMLSLLYWGKKVLSPAWSTGDGGGSTEGPCQQGTVLGDYCIQGEIGRGGMGVVYE